MAQPRWNRLGKLAIKIAVAIAVIGAVGRHVARTWHDLREHGESLHFEVAWIAVCVGLYLGGLSVFGVYYWRVMGASSTPISLASAVRAYLISHLGKYVPGKAMVVVMRVGYSVPYGARPATAAFGTLYETLVMMAAGGMVAALGFAVSPVQFLSWVIGLGLGLGLALVVLVEPSIFPKIAALMSLPFPGVGSEALPVLTRRLWGEGVAWAIAGWTLLGLSLVALVRALVPAGVPLASWPTVVAGVALATVAGFVVAILPGGLGVREGVLMTTLAPTLGTDIAVVSALALRLAWVLAEVLAAAVLSVLRPPSPRPAES